MMLGFYSGLALTMLAILCSVRWQYRCALTLNQHNQYTSEQRSKLLKQGQIILSIFLIIPSALLLFFLGAMMNELNNTMIALSIGSLLTSTMTAMGTPYVIGGWQHWCKRNGHAI
ncbi:hypothetical protein AB6D11_06035 [Vibrio splendidus]